jgi:hypothetical protein
MSAVGMLGAKFFFLWLGAAFAEAPVSVVFHEIGGIRGFFGLASDLKLAGDSDSVVAEHAASRLLHQCGQEDGMIKLAQIETRPNVQRWLLQSLAGCNSQKAIPIFRKALLSTNDMVVLVGAQSLGMVGAREAIPDLKEVLKKCSAQCAGEAAASLARLGEHDISYAWAIDALTAKPPHGYNSDDRFKRYHAARALRYIGTEKDIPLLEANMHFSAGGLLETQEIIDSIRHRDSKQ